MGRRSGLAWCDGRAGRRRISLGCEVEIRSIIKQDVTDASSDRV